MESIEKIENDNKEYNLSTDMLQFQTFNENVYKKKFDELLNFVNNPANNYKFFNTPYFRPGHYPEIKVSSADKSEDLQNSLYVKYLMMTRTPNNEITFQLVVDIENDKNISNVYLAAEQSCLYRNFEKISDADPTYAKTSQTDPPNNILLAITE